MLVNPFSKHGIDRAVRDYSARQVKISGFLAALLTAAFFVTAIFLLGLLGEHYLLRTIGVQAEAKVLETTSHVRRDPHRHMIAWKKIVYSFSAERVETVIGTVDRPAHELVDLQPKQFTILYWARSPSVNMPSAMRYPDNVIIGILIWAMALVVMFAFLSYRLFTYRRT